jgi:tetratricopeptide (TPR) repeat protein
MSVKTETVEQIRRVGQRNRRSWWWVSIMMLLIAGAALLWERYRISANPEAQLDSAYLRGDWERTSALARARLKEAPADVKALRMAARAAARQDQDQKAIAIYQRLDPESQEAEDLFLLGRAWIRAGRIDPAFKAYQAARAKDPDHPETLAALAGLYMRTDRFHAAAETARQLARLPEWEARAQLMLGSALSESQDHAGAARALQRWAQLDPQGRAVAPYPAASLKKRLARSWLRSGQPAEAQIVLSAILGAGPDSEASWLLSRCFIQVKDWKRAAEFEGQHSQFRAEHPLEPEPSPYVGETRCAGCHRAESEAVHASRHATTFSRARDLRTFSLPANPLHDPGDPGITHQIQRQGDSLGIETREKSEVFRAVIDYAFGSLDNFTTFVGRDDGGGARMIRMSHYRSPRGTGWDIATGLPLHPTDEEEYLGKKMFEVDGVRRCLGCHTTNVRAILQEVGPEAADRSIGCECCHGPGGHHVAAVAAEFSETAIGNLGAASPADRDQMCDKCHGVEIPDELNLPRTDPVWLRFQSLTLKWSRCYTQSNRTLGCVTCHDPHRNVETSGPRNEAKCLSCHAADPAGNKVGPSGSGALRRHAAATQDTSTERATRISCPVNPTQGCIDCHMPRIWVQSTHSYKADHFIRIHDRFPSEVDGASRIGHE